jgi:hypothetical protein
MKGGHANLNQLAQEEQLEEPQVEHPLPVTGVVAPPASLEKQANLDSTLLVLFLHFGQAASSSTSLKRRRSSNLFLQSAQ